MPALCLNVQEYHLTNIALSFGGGWDYGKNIGAKENAEALQFLIDAYREGYIVTPTELGLSWDGAVMIQQSALFSTGGAWYQASFASEAPDIELKYLPVPKGGNGNGGGTCHSAALVALKNSKHPEEVAKAISYAVGGDKLYEAVVDVTEVIPAKVEYFDLYKEKVPALADLVSYLDSSTPFSYPTQSKKFADSLINLMQETMFDESSTMTGQDIVEQLAAEYGAE
ncbi:extracellular solute-binding protein [Eisenbergiella porci]|nr:extracellular solute-binding protein [Eisenbergiella porci]